MNSWAFYKITVLSIGNYGIFNQTQFNLMLLTANIKLNIILLCFLEYIL